MLFGLFSAFVAFAFFNYLGLFSKGYHSAPWFAPLNEPPIECG